MSRKYFLYALFFIAATVSISAQQVIQKGKALFLSNTLVVKVKEGTSLERLSKLTANYSVESLKEIYPSKGVLNKSAGSKVLKGIYLVRYNTTENPVKLAAEIAGSPDVLWAEPKYVRRICLTPDDSIYSAGNQEYLDQINAANAWDITTGDKKIIIGIVDVGVDWKHPDLAANIYMENGSLIPGSDLGGLHGTSDDDPSEDINPAGRYHGTFIAGAAGAVTDNKIGVASIGFNCSILPVKASKDDSRINGEALVEYGFEGIKWAADHGAKVINCSWGGYGHSEYEQSVIDYAISKGALVVASYGNDSSNSNFYPAAYNGVLSVGWLNTGIGVKTVNPDANYGKNVKVFAPGSGIYSTWQRPEESSPGIYKSAGGSSASAPLVSGLAGLVWSVFPSYTPLQVLERIRVTSDYIDDYNKSSYKNLLGHGVINASRSVDRNVKAISVRADSIHFTGTGNQEGIFGPGEEVSIYIEFTNYLANTDNITVTLNTQDSYVTIENGTFDTGPMDTLTTISNESNVFRFKIAANTPNNHSIDFLLKFSNGTDYTDFQWTNVKTTNSYLTHSNNNITLTVTSKGTLGFNDFPYNQAGRGFKYKGSKNLMYEGAFMYGISPSKIMNEARVIDRQKQDFIYDAPVKTFDRTDEFYGVTRFSDSGAGTNALGIVTILSSYSSSEFTEANYISLISRLDNITSKDINQLYAGYFIDWNIPEDDPGNDTTYFDDENNIAIAYNTRDAASPYTVMGLINAESSFGYYAIDNNATSGQIRLGDTNGFTDAEKWYALSNGVNKNSAGTGDISYVISAGPYNIPAGQGIVVEFVIGADSTLQGAVDAVLACRERRSGHVEQIPSDFQLDQNYPNPFNSTTLIGYKLSAGRRVTLKLYDLLGRTVVTFVDGFQHSGEYQVRLSTGKYKLSSGVYFYRLTAGDFSSTKKMILIK